MNLFKNLTFLLFLGSLASCGSKHNLTAQIENLGNDTIIVEYGPVSKFYELDNPYTDTIIATNGKFTYDLTLEEPTFAFMFPQKAAFKRADGSKYLPRQKYLVLLLKPNEQISVQGKLHEYYLEYTAKGSDFNKEYSQLRSGYIEETSEAAKVELQIDSLMAIHGDKEQINALFRQRNQTNNKAVDEQREFIKNNWNNELSAYLLTQQRLDTLANYYNNLTAEVKEGTFKNMLESQYLRYQKYTRLREAEGNIIEGKTAPDFKLKSLSGDDFSLSSINDKIVVLDFWGSWCGWCIKGFPKMKTYYEKYNDQLEIVGIACNDTEEKWKKSVEENQLNWLHVINNEDIDKDVSVMYGIQGYPTKIIMDKDRTILAKFVGESDDFYNKLDELLKK